MKKIAVLYIILCLLTVHVYAQNTVNCSFILDFENDELNYAVNVKGTVEPDTLVSVMIKEKETDNIVALEQCTSNETGNFSLQIPLQSGCFDVVVNDYMSNDRQSMELNIPGIEYYQAIVDEFNGVSSAEELAGLIISKKDELGLDIRYFTDDMQGKISGRLYAKKGSYTISNIRKLFDQSVIYAYLYDERRADISNQIIAYYDEYMNIAGSAEPRNIYKSYMSFPEGMQQNIADRAFAKEQTSYEQIKESFNNAVVLEAFAQLSKTDLDVFITDNIDYVAFDGYENLTLMKKGEILSVLQAKKDIKNVSELISEYEKIIKNAPGSDSGNTGNTGNTGNIGGTGGGGSKPMGSKSYSSDIVTESQTASNNENTVAQSIFDDIDEVSWAKDSITELYKRGIVNGKENNRFCPNDPITRAEFVKIVVNAFDLQNESAAAEFDDVDKNDWSYTYIASAVSAGIISGYEDNTFRSDECLTRQDMAVIFHRALVKLKQISPVENIQNPFADFNDINPYARNSVLMLYNSGIVSGVGDNRFAPLENTSRAEVCKMIHNNILRGGNTGA